MLKGCSAVLARVADARTTQDVDLLRQLDDLESAYAELITAANRGVDDHLRFEAVQRVPGGQGQDQPAVEGCRVIFDAYCGITKLNPVKVDLVVGPVMTSAPEEVAQSVFEIEGMSPIRMQLYPVVDHVADKVCATQARYGSSGGRSSRVRDLVDLVVLARSQNIDGDSLSVALRSEWAMRELEGSLIFDPPSDWENQYPPMARRVQACGEYTTFESA